MLLENEHDTHAACRQNRVQAEELAKQVEQLHSATQSDLKLHMEKGTCHVLCNFSALLKICFFDDELKLCLLKFRFTKFYIKLITK